MAAKPSNHRVPWTKDETETLIREVKFLTDMGKSRSAACKILRPKFHRKHSALMSQLFRAGRSPIPTQDDVHYMACREGRYYGDSSPEKLLAFLAETADCGDLTKFGFFRATPVTIHVERKIVVKDA
jgi:hypothetical protein